MRKLLAILVAITICTPVVAQAMATRGQCICDPVPTQWYNPWTQGWDSSGYLCAAWISAPATIRVEILKTPLSGGTPTVAAVFDVNVVPVGSPGSPLTSGDWGRPLLEAIANHNDVLVAGPIIHKAWCGESVWSWNAGCQYWREMAVNSAPNTRIAIRCISTAQEGTPLPALPWMPPLAECANNWPAGPDPYQGGPSGRDVNFGSGTGIYCETGTLGLVGGHMVANPPNWNGVASEASHDTSYDTSGGIMTMTILDPAVSDIPTVSEWGLIIMAGLLLTVGAVVIMRRRRVAA